MKKLSLTLFVAMTVSCVFAEELKYYDASTNQNTWEMADWSNGNDLIIPEAIFSDYNGSSGDAITVISNPNAWNGTTVSNFNQSFHFKDGFIINNKGGGWNDYQFNIYNGSTLTFDTLMQYKGNTSIRYSFVSKDSNKAKIVINTNLTKDDGGVVSGSHEMMLKGVDVEYNGTNDDGRFGYTHFYNGSKLTATTGLYMSTLCIRTSTDTTTLEDGTRNFGTLVIEKVVTVNSLERNAGTETGRFTIQFNDKNVDEVFVLNSASTAEINEINENNTQILLKDFVYGDTIYSQIDLTVINNISVDGTALSTLIANGTINVVADKYGTTDYAYVYTVTTAVPEPSTYALIFGALALGFVAYRRRR